MCRIRVRYGGTPPEHILAADCRDDLASAASPPHVPWVHDVVFATHVEWFPPLQSLPLHQEAPLIPSETVRSLRGGQYRKFPCRAWRHTPPSSDTAASLRLAMFRFQQATGPIDQVSQLALEPEHSALPLADFVQWVRRISSLNFADDFDESRRAQFGWSRDAVGRGQLVRAEAFQRSGNYLKRLVERRDVRGPMNFQILQVAHRFDSLGGQFSHHHRGSVEV
jgi:hypothetical protein